MPGFESPPPAQQSDALPARPRPSTKLLILVGFSRISGYLRSLTTTLLQFLNLLFPDDRDDFYYF